jgi:hypothetical protein
VQNAVERRNLGVATSSVTFFRSIGSSLGAAIFGAIIGNRLAHHLIADLPSNVGPQVAESIKGSATSLQQLPTDTLHLALTAFAKSFSDVFLFAIPFAFIAFLVALLLREVPLKLSHEPSPISE